MLEIQRVNTRGSEAQDMPVHDLRAVDDTAVSENLVGPVRDYDHLVHEDIDRTFIDRGTVVRSRRRAGSAGRPPPL